MKAKRSFCPLSLYERERIGVYRAQGYSGREIAKQLGRHHTTISRELRRNNQPHPHMKGYVPSLAEQQARTRKAQAGQRLRLKHPAIQQYVKDRMQYPGWSPEIIAAQIPKAFPGYSISYEAIYQFVYEQWKEGIAFLARRHPTRYPKSYARRRNRSPIPNKLSIQVRPEAANQRKEGGHWESDTVVSSHSLVAIQVLHERLSRVVRFTRIERKTAAHTEQAICHRLGSLPPDLLKSITYDNGSENYYHERVNDTLGTQSYFCAPYHSWEKGAVENTNGLLRRFIPKRMDLSQVTQRQLDRIEYLLNTRPRKCLNWKTPIEVFRQLCGGATPC